MSYMYGICCVPLVKNTFFKSHPSHKNARIVNPKTPDLDFMDSWSAFGFAQKITAEYIIIALFISWINYGTNEWKKIAINEFISPLGTGTLGLVWL